MPFVPLEAEEATSVAPQHGFIPLDAANAQGRGFTPLGAHAEADRTFDGAAKTIEAIGAVYPVAETAANLASQAVAMPVAGLAGLGAAATKAVGLTDAEPGDVVHSVAGALTYQPQTELGQHLTGAAMYPFEKLAEGARHAGEKTLDATGSPAAATAVDTAINSLPMALGVRRGETARAPNQSRQAPIQEARTNLYNSQQPAPFAEQPRGFTPTPEYKADIALQSIGKAATVDEAIALFNEATANPIRLPESSTSLVPAGLGKTLPEASPETIAQPDVNPMVVDTLVQPDISQASQAMIRPGDVQAKVDIGSGAIVSTAGMPYKTQNGARLALHAKGLQQSHEIVPVGEGFGLMPKKQTAEPMQSVPHDIEPFSVEAGASALPDEIIAPARSGASLAQPSNPKITAMSEPVKGDIGVRLSESGNFQNALSDKPMDQVHNSWAPGTNYVGVGVDRAVAGAKLSDKPIRREDVLIPFMKALDTTLYEGRVKGKNRLGFYIPGKQAVRIKGKSDLEVASHEIAHLIDDRVPEIKRVYLNDKTLREELRGVSYDSSKIHEGFAEFVRLYMTQPEQAMDKAPNYYRWFDDLTQRHEYGPAIRQAQEGMSAWFNQDALHRAQSKIGMQRDLNSALDGVFDKFRQSSLDDLHGVYRMERSLKGKIEPLGAYEISRNTRGAGAMVDGAIRLGAPIRKPDGSFVFNGKGLQQILDPVASELDSFLHYAVGRSARELQMQGREKLFTREEVNAMLALEKPEYKQAFNEYQQWNKAVLDFAEAQGILNPHIRQMFSRQQYIPFYRAGQPGAYNAGGVTGNWSGIKKLTGGDENLRPILGNMIQNASMLIEASLKNEARAKIVELASQKGGGKFLVKIEADQRPVKIDKAQVKDELLKAAGIDPTAARMGMLDAEQAKVVEAIEQAIDQAPGFFEFMLHNQAPSGNVMAVLRNGKPEYYEVADPLLFRAVQSLNRPAQNWLIRLLGWPKRIGQATITLTPDFMVANLARDTIMASIMSKAGFKPFMDSVRGMASRIKTDPAYQEFIANGGGFASYLRDEATFKAHLERFYTGKGIDYRTVLDTPDKLLYGLETIADAFEMSSRLGEYKRLRAKGEHPRHAAYAAREISTDFAMRGDSKELGFLYDTVMFLRPAVVSMDRMARGLLHDENKGAIAAKAGTLALMSVGLYLVNRDKPEYQDLADWDKDGNWHFFIPQQDGSTSHLRYPKIWEIGALASISERTMGKLLDDEPALGKSVAGIVRKVFNLNLMPQIVAPLYEQATNRNSFTGAPIETPGMENVQPWLRAKPTTSETMKALGEATRNLPEGAQVPPARAEALLRGYFNTWAMYGLMLTDSALFGKQLPERRMDELPVVRRFYSADPAKHTKYEEMFYEMLGEAERLRGTMRELDQRSMKSIADEYDANPKTARASQLQRASDSLTDISIRMEEVRRSNKTPEQKRLELDALLAKRNALLKAAVSNKSEVKAPESNRSGFTPLQ